MNRSIKCLLFYVIGLMSLQVIAAPINSALLSRKDTFTQYLSKKVPGSVRSWVQQYLKRHPKLTAMGKQLYRYRYVFGAALLGLSGYYAKKQRARLQPPPGGQINFAALPDYVRNDRLVQRLEAFHREQIVKGKVGLGMDSVLPWLKFSRTRVRDLLTALEKELRNPAEQKLFCRLVQNFNREKPALGLKKAHQVELQNYFGDDDSLYFLSQHPQMRALLDPFLSDNTLSPPIYFKKMGLKPNVWGKWFDFTDTYLQEVDFARINTIYWYYWISHRC